MRAFAPTSVADTTRALGAHLAAHNLRVLGIAGATLLTAVALWAGVYGFCGWMILLAQAAVDSPQTGFPRHFHVVFIGIALSLIAIAWVLRRMYPDDFPSENKTAWEYIFDFLLAIPRVTLSIGGTLAAWQHLSKTDLAQAAAFLQRLAEVRRLPLHQAPLEIADEVQRARILFALQLTRVIDLRRHEREWWIVPHAQRPQSLRLAA